MEELKLKNQLCFPLYVASKEVIKKYKPILDEVDLTYTQYITMMVLWEYGNINVKSLGDMLYLDSGTLTPLLKKLESKKYIKRHRDKNDERNLIISITNEGKELQNKVKNVPKKVSKCIDLSEEEAITLYKLLYKVLGKIGE